MNHGAHGEHGEKPAWDLSQEVVQCALRVHTELGPGLLESAYTACLAFELTRSGISYEREKTLPVIYRGTLLDCGYRVDLLVDRRMIVEVKAVDALLPVHEAQVLTYLKLASCKVGLLMNFNSKLLRNGIKRFVL